MQVSAARALAAQWILDTAASQRDFEGAFFCGSVNDADPHAEFSVDSDLDLAIVYAGDPPAMRAGKFLHEGIVFDVSYWPIRRLQPMDRVLSDYRIGHSFRGSNVISGSSPRLISMAAEAEQEFPKRTWLKKRVEDARANCLRYVDATAKHSNQFDRVIAWLWAAGLTTHIILAAGLKNPTIRKRYLAAREVLAEHGRLDLHEFLLSLQGSGHLGRGRVQAHLDGLTEVFDAACDAGPRPFPYSSDINRISRTLAIDGTQGLINSGFHRESVFWIVATYARCLKAFDHTADVMRLRRFRPCFDRLLGDLGIESPDDLQARAEAVRDAIPQVMEVAGSIMDARSYTERR